MAPAAPCSLAFGLELAALSVALVIYLAFAVAVLVAMLGLAIKDLWTASRRAKAKPLRFWAASIASVGVVAVGFGFAGQQQAPQTPAVDAPALALSLFAVAVAFAAATVGGSLRALADPMVRGKNALKEGITAVGTAAAATTIATTASITTLLNVGDLCLFAVTTIFVVAGSATGWYAYEFKA